MAETRTYKDRKGKWRWRRVASNGLITADSGQGYASKRNAGRAWDRVAADVNAERDEMLVSIMRFINSELDVFEGPWSAYFADDAHVAIADELEARYGR